MSSPEEDWHWGSTHWTLLTAGCCPASWPPAECWRPSSHWRWSRAAWRREGGPVSRSCCPPAWWPSHWPLRARGHPPGCSCSGGWPAGWGRGTHRGSRPSPAQSLQCTGLDWHCRLYTDNTSRYHLWVTFYKDPWALKVLENLHLFRSFCWNILARKRKQEKQWYHLYFIFYAPTMLEVEKIKKGMPFRSLIHTFLLLKWK